VCDERLDRFVLTLALPIAPASASLSRGEVRGQIARAVLRGRVLVVDDTAENRELLGSLVAAAGLEVDLVADGEAALELAEHKLFDLALVDLRMPGLDGFALRAALDERARRDGEVRLPVVAVTADAVAGTRERCLAAGFADCVYKPIEGDALLRVVRRRLRRNVLVADDDGDLRALVAAFLEDAGWRVFSVDDGAQAVALLSDRTVHAMVVDLEMPVLDGFGVIDRARAIVPHTPVIALTGHRDPETRRRAQAAGFHEVLTKPLLVERLRTLLP
jgi:CheY-like chemotaxis protein